MRLDRDSQSVLNEVLSMTAQESTAVLFPDALPPDPQ